MLLMLQEGWNFTFLTGQDDGHSGSGFVEICKILSVPGILFFAKMVQFDRVHQSNDGDCRGQCLISGSKNDACGYHGNDGVELKKIRCRMQDYRQYKRTCHMRSPCGIE